MVSSTCVNILVTVSSNKGSKSATASKIAPVAVGNAATIFSNTGTMLVTTALKASTDSQSNLSCLRWYCQVLL